MKKKNIINEQKKKIRNVNIVPNARQQSLLPLLNQSRKEKGFKTPLGQTD